MIVMASRSTFHRHRNTALVTQAMTPHANIGVRGLVGPTAIRPHAITTKRTNRKTHGNGANSVMATMRQLIVFARMGARIDDRRFSTTIFQF